MIPALVLAGGASSRMGRPKALLPAPDGRPFIARIIWTLAEAGVRDIVVVTGFEHASVIEAAESGVADPRPRFVRNPEPSRGQLSSLWCGLDAVADVDPPAALVTLVDVPMILPATVRAVIARWHESGAPIVRPLYRGRRGHPVVFGRQMFAELRAAPLEKGARTVVEAHRSESIDVPVDDPGCTVDVDTSEDYRRLRGL